MSEVALVTGASRGLGLSIANHLATSGFWVILTYNRGESEANLAVEHIGHAGGTAVALHLDVTDLPRLPAFVETVRKVLADVFGQHHLDHLANNAGIGTYAPFEATTELQFDELFATNVKGPYFLTQALLGLLGDQSRILNVSTAVVRSAVPGLSAYAASKGAVEVMTRYMAVELAGSGIRVNTLVGGAIDTGFGDGMMLTEQVQTMAQGQIALGRMGHADDMAAAVPAILSGSFAWATGANIEVSGGQNL